MLPLVVTGITSTNAMIKRLGGKRWRALHRPAYVAAIAGVIHYYKQDSLLHAGEGGCAAAAGVRGGVDCSAQLFACSNTGASANARRWLLPTARA